MFELGDVEASLGAKGVQSIGHAPHWDLFWSEVSFNTKNINILTDCWGSVPAGKVCAIFGASGAGKSSLLNVLAGRSAPAPGIHISGNVSVAGKPINPVKFRENIAYVMQDDALMATATPQEALEFSARLRLPPSTSVQEIQGLVAKLIDELGLNDCKDVMIGGQLIKGISGGERKRTSVGIELITNPSLLFLDEPTSGLDSYSAFNLVKLLRKVAERNAVILCTIHQPSSEVFNLFDIAIFMKEGRIFYQGPVSSVVSYFNDKGCICPPNYNPCDFVIKLTQTEKTSDLEAKGMFMTDPQKSTDTKNDRLLIVENGPVTIDVHIKASLSTQIVLLTYRELLNTIRDVAALAGRFGVTILLNFLFGLIFLNAADRDDSISENFQAHFGAITLVSIASLFGTAQPVLLAFPFERPMFMREYSTGSYSAVAYLISKAALEFPLAFLQTIVQYILVYFMIGMNGNFIYIVLSAWGIGISASSTSVILGCAVADVKSVTELAPLVFIPQLLFAGFFIRTSLIPVFIRWAQWLCGLKYGLNLILLTEFSPDNDACKDAAAETCAGVLTSNDIKGDDWWIYFLLLASITVSFRIIGGLILVQKSKRFY